MAGGKGNFALATPDFRLQGSYTFFEFAYRKRVEILPDQIGQRIVAAERQIFVAFHTAYFNPTALAVNIQPA